MLTSLKSDDSIAKKRKSAGKGRLNLKIETMSPYPKAKTTAKKTRVKSAANVSAIVGSRTRDDF